MIGAGAAGRSAEGFTERGTARGSDRGSERGTGRIPARGAERSFLAFDYGSRRIGVASGNTVLGRAQPLTTVARVGDARFDAIGALIREWRPDALVVGVPCHPDGAPHDNTARARRFARQLHGRFGLPVHEVDERYSTTAAIAGGAADVDAASAAIILDQHLQQGR